MRMAMRTMRWRKIQEDADESGFLVQEEDEEDDEYEEDKTYGDEIGDEDNELEEDTIPQKGGC